MSQKKMFLPFCVKNTLRIALLQEKHVLVSLWYKWAVFSDMLRKKVVCQSPASYFDFNLILLKRTFLYVFG